MSEAAQTTSWRVPQEAEIVERVAEGPSIFTLWLRLRDAAAHAAYSFVPGQFNMLYLYGAGEVPISIVSDPQHEDLLAHTIRPVGRVTRALAQLRAGDHIGLRGPFGRGWPLARAAGRDVVLLTGGLGCAPVAAVIHYLMRRREEFGRLIIIQGVKHSADLIWRDCYEDWAARPGIQVLLAADVAGPNWPWLTGRVTVLLEQAEFDPRHCLVMMCGPELMMRFSARHLLARGVAADDICLSLERNMHCAVGHCGHCQFGARFICRDGPVFHYSELANLFGKAGF